MNHHMAVCTDWNKVSHRVHTIGFVHLRNRCSVMYLCVPLPEVAVERFEVKATSLAGCPIVLDARGTIHWTSLIPVDFDTYTGALRETLDFVELTR